MQNAWGCFSENINVAVHLWWRQLTKKPEFAAIHLLPHWPHASYTDKPLHCRLLRHLWASSSFTNSMKVNSFADDIVFLHYVLYLIGKAPSLLGVPREPQACRSLGLTTCHLPTCCGRTSQYVWKIPEGVSTYVTLSVHSPLLVY